MDERGRRARILVVDDAKDTVEVIRRNLVADGHAVLTAGSVAEAVGVLAGHAVDLVITDMRMPGGSGMQLVRHVHENLRDTEVLVVTGYATVEGAVEAVKAGAETYLAKPFTEKELRSAVEAALGKLGARRAALAAAEGGGSPRWGLIGGCESMQRVESAVRRLARGSGPVLVIGERGSGRRQVARALHAAAGSKGEFSELRPIESEPRGDGREKRILPPGMAGGTIYLSDVTELAPEVQAEVLGLPEIRVVASSVVGLEQALLRGWVQPKLGVHVIELPPLRERGEDLLVLLHHFLRQAAARARAAVPAVTDPILRVLATYAWPGNVRELRDLAEQVVAADLHEITLPDLPSHFRFSARSEGEKVRSLAEVEWDHLQAVLASVGGNKSRAAELVGIDRKTLREKLRRPPRA